MRNDEADMSIFDGTEYAGLTWHQVRRRLTPAQAARFKALGKRNTKTARGRSGLKTLVSTYK